ncbi:MAG: MarR family transcriptional regulator [Alphaproteobacteria bacterium]|nr:MAG: MarR family transcriptional regulator [Alphaproteobacteria bacterium]
MSKYSLQNSPGPLIRRIHQIGMSIFAEEFRDIDITPLQFSLMWILRQHSGLDQVTLAQSVALDRTTCSNIVIRMEKKKYINRKVDPDNKRAKLVFLTKTGEDIMKAAEKHMDRVQNKLIQPLSKEEKKTFMKCLTKLAASNNELSRAPMRFLPLK